MPEESWEEGIGAEIGIGGGGIVSSDKVILNEVKNLGARHIVDKRYEYQSAGRFLDCTQNDGDAWRRDRVPSAGSGSRS